MHRCGIERQPRRTSLLLLWHPYLTMPKPKGLQYRQLLLSLTSDLHCCSTESMLCKALLCFVLQPLELARMHLQSVYLQCRAPVHMQLGLHMHLLEIRGFGKWQTSCAWCCRLEAHIKNAWRSFSSLSFVPAPQHSQRPERHQCTHERWPLASQNIASAKTLQPLLLQPVRLRPGEHRRQLGRGQR